MAKNALLVCIGEHHMLIYVQSPRLQAFIKMFFRVESIVACDSDCHHHCDLQIEVEDEYGAPFVDFSVDVCREGGRVLYSRTDYFIDVDETYHSARIGVYDEFALKHALMNLYSAFIVFHNWGLLIHSCCVLDAGTGHLFAGRSGAGKSTVARLSLPRELVSDEATIVRISNTEVTVFDSPFRSDSSPSFSTEQYPLKSIQLLKQSPIIDRTLVSRIVAMFDLMDKVFYWSVDGRDARKVFRLLQMMLKQVPVYQLQFQKNAQFWEAIS